MTSYLVNKEDVVNFLDNPNMKNQDGYMFAYVTSPEVLARLVPKPLTPIAPVIAGYITHMGNPTFAKPYDDAVLYSLVSYGGRMLGAYPFTLFLSGEGAEEAMLAGREGAAIPKKLADKISYTEKNGSTHVVVTRHGVDLINLTFTPGIPNDPDIAKQLMGGQSKLDTPTDTYSFFFDYKIDQDHDGHNHFINTRLIATKTTGVTHAFTPGNITMELGTSSDDPVSELTVLKPVGGAHYQMTSGKMHETIQLAQVEPDEIAPYLITGRYDQAILGK